MMLWWPSETLSPKLKFYLKKLCWPWCFITTKESCGTWTDYVAWDGLGLLILLSPLKRWDCSHVPLYHVWCWDCHQGPHAGNWGPWHISALPLKLLRKVWSCGEWWQLDGGCRERRKEWEKWVFVHSKAGKWLKSIWMSHLGKGERNLLTISLNSDIATLLK